jgi:hypothetical protein
MPARPYVEGLAAQRRRTTAELRAAGAANETDQHARAQLEHQATDACAQAHLLDQWAKKLERADEIRPLWYAHTAFPASFGGVQVVGIEARARTPAAFPGRSVPLTCGPADRERP